MIMGYYNSITYTMLYHPERWYISRYADGTQYANWRGAGWKQQPIIDITSGRRIGRAGIDQPDRLWWLKRHKRRLWLAAQRLKLHHAANTTQTMD